jgi:hypothetical protein
MSVLVRIEILPRKILLFSLSSASSRARVLDVVDPQSRSGKKTGGISPQAPPKQERREQLFVTFFALLL